MHFEADKNETTESLWEKIVLTIGPKLSKEISPNTSSFINTKDGLECNVRNTRGDLLANCYSENDRMGKRRWTIEVMPIT